MSFLFLFFFSARIIRSQRKGHSGKVTANVRLRRAMANFLVLLFLTVRTCEFHRDLQGKKVKIVLSSSREPINYSTVQFVDGLR